MRALHLSLAPLASQFPVTDTQQQNLPPRPLLRPIISK